MNAYMFRKVIAATGSPVCKLPTSAVRLTARCVEEMVAASKRAVR